MRTSERDLEICPLLSQAGPEKKGHETAIDRIAAVQATASKRAASEDAPVREIVVSAMASAHLRGFLEASKAGRPCGAECISTSVRTP